MFDIVGWLLHFLQNSPGTIGSKPRINQARSALDVFRRMKCIAVVFLQSSCGSFFVFVLCSVLSGASRSKQKSFAQSCKLRCSLWIVVAVMFFFCISFNHGHPFVAMCLVGSCKAWLEEVATTAPFLASRPMVQRSDITVGLLWSFSIASSSGLNGDLKKTKAVFGCFRITFHGIFNHVVYLPCAFPDFPGINISKWSQATHVKQAGAMSLVHPLTMATLGLVWLMSLSVCKTLRVTKPPWVSAQDMVGSKGISKIIKKSILLWMWQGSRVNQYWCCCDVTIPIMGFSTFANRKP